jgi:hypothetical protein
VVCGVLLLHVAGLLGCPQLLDDGFDTVQLSPDGGLGGMTLTGRGGTAGSAGATSGGSGGSAGDGGSSAGTGGSGGSGSTGGTGDSGGTAGTAGTGGSSAGTGGSSAGTGGSSAGTAGTGGTSGDTPACWTFELTTTNADHDSNCVGVDGYNQIEVNSPSSVTLSYENGDACFSGTIAATGWGAVYSHVFANLGAANDSLSWDATEYGVTGFELTTTGDALPPSFKVTYAINIDNTRLEDYCQTIGTGPALVPFAGATRDSCGGGDTGALTDTTELEALRLSFPVGTNAYSVDFCLRIRALP